MEEFQAPFAERIELRQIIHESGVPLLRVVIRDGSKCTKLDPAAAHQWGRAMCLWAETVGEK
jgi:hypothetical protein